MATDLFRREGWLVDLKVGRSHDELIDELDQTDLTILGLTISSRENLPSLTRLIAAVRVSAPHAFVMVAGHLAKTEPNLQTLTDADAVSIEVDTSLEIMTGFYKRIAARPGRARGRTR